MEKFFKIMSIVYVVIALICKYYQQESTFYFFCVLALYAEVKAHLHKIEEEIKKL